VDIREARVEDAAAVCEVLRRSIVELCCADHHDDPAVLEQWLANKTPQHVAAWISRADNRAFLAVEADTVLGIAMITVHGEILLNYVSPHARFRGVSKALLAWLEATAQALGNAECSLTSTVTAHRFYQAAGYRDRESPLTEFGAGTMVKRLLD
jgi:GNAT superfamily N-acetyltransferase